MKKKYIRKFLIILLALIMIITGIKIIDWINDNKKTDASIKEISVKAKVKEVDDNDNIDLLGKEEDENNPYWYYIKFPLIDVDIKELKKENDDIIGWLNVNNTNINYPFVQTNDNDYYLNHSIDKSSNEAGWLFLDYRNESNLHDKNSIIYGHSRLNKTMFGSLSKVLKSSWYNDKDNHIIRISSEDENTSWQIFSVYKIKTESYYLTTVFTNDDEYMNFLNTIKDRSIYDFNTSLNASDQILTLSTCYSDTEKTVVHAKLIKRAKK